MIRKKSWEDNAFRYPTFKTMREDEEAKTHHVFQESSSLGIFEGTITVNEKRRKNNLKKLKENWKVLLIVLAGISAVIQLCVFSVQSAQNRAFALEEQVNTAESDIKI